MSCCCNLAASPTIACQAAINKINSRKPPNCLQTINHESPILEIKVSTVLASHSSLTCIIQLFDRPYLSAYKPFQAAENISAFSYLDKPFGLVIDILIRFHYTCSNGLYIADSYHANLTCDVSTESNEFNYS